MSGPRRIGEFAWEIPTDFKAGMRVPGVVFDPASKGAQAFVAFAQEMVARIASL